MLTVEQIKNLKKVNISKDPEKTKTRIAQDFKSAPNATKTIVIELSGQTRASIYRAYETGVVTPKTVVSMAQTFDVSPFYYTGAEDEKGSCTDEVLARFLEESGNGKIAQELINKPKRKYTRRIKPENIQQADELLEENIPDEDQDQQDIQFDIVSQEAPCIEPASCECSLKMNNAVENLDEESAIILLRGLYKRAQASDKSEQLLVAVKKSLLM